MSRLRDTFRDMTPDENREASAMTLPQTENALQPRFIPSPSNWSLVANFSHSIFPHLQGCSFADNF